ncbi:basic helix-loop-helix (bHLH) DNA-binding superfamily protein [Raphanus sativus]|uniref:Transcription factor bHLH160 n=1 Tax=Raphanus sativus TaxID=3726 RepID=A0A6J0LWQ0_RAPSA|nr:transcription factor bHLH160 [Raphanus sativus]KAJ4909528.1 basic helix-loop-helix (bHLH) DNA-binding superfamily protein [Raphanus sativus]
MPNHQDLASSLLEDLFLHIPAETIGASGEKNDTCQAQPERKGKEVVLHVQDAQESSGVAKKQERNANERLRRLRLHASYLTLGTLLPDHSSSSKKKWCAPSIMDRVVTYIPKLHNEVEELTLRKKKLVEEIESKSSRGLSERQDPHIRAISVLELEGSGDEIVVQVSMKRLKEDDFSNLLHVMEMQGFSILSASTSLVCRDQKVVCYNFHVKIVEKPSEGEDYITVLKNNIISTLY